MHEEVRRDPKNGRQEKGGRDMEQEDGVMEYRDGG